MARRLQLGEETLPVDLTGYRGVTLRRAWQLLGDDGEPVDLSTYAPAAQVRADLESAELLAALVCTGTAGGLLTVELLPVPLELPLGDHVWDLLLGPAERYRFAAGRFTCRQPVTR